MDAKTHTTPPTVGTLATLRIGSDKYPGKIVAVSATGYMITFEHDRPQSRKDRGGNDLVRATLRKDGTYRPVRCGRWSAIKLGVAERYYDPHL